MEVGGWRSFGQSRTADGLDLGNLGRWQERVGEGWAEGKVSRRNTARGDLRFHLYCLIFAQVVANLP